MEASRKLKKVTTVIGAFLLAVPHGLYWFWGGISVYSSSYILAHTDAQRGVQAPWLMSLYLISFNVTVAFSDVVARLVSRRWAVVLAIVVADVATFSSYWSVQTSMFWLDVSYGFVHGMAGGILYGSSIYLIIQTATDDVGRLSSIAQGSVLAGGIIISKLVTAYTNPQNEAPNLVTGSSVYFSQKDILDRVPSSFLVLGAFSLAMHLIGLGFLQLNPMIAFFGIKDAEITDKETIPIKQNGEIKKKENNTSIKRKGVIREEITLPSKDNGKDVVDECQPGDIDGTEGQNDIPTREVLKTFRFYILWVSFFLYDIPFILLTNFYKVFGQIWIHDDHFLTNLGAGIFVSGIVFRLLWGVLVDKLSHRLCYLINFGLLTLLTCWFYFAPMTNRWLYFFVTLLYGGTNGSITVIYMATLVALYGKKYVSTNYGGVMTSGIVLNLVAPVAIRSCLETFGWFGTFIASSFLTLFNLIMCILFLP